MIMSVSPLLFSFFEESYLFSTMLVHRTKCIVSLRRRRFENEVIFTAFSLFWIIVMVSDSCSHLGHAIPLIYFFSILLF